MASVEADIAKLNDSESASNRRIASADLICGAAQKLDRWFLVVLVIFSLPLVVAVFTDAALTWDGAYYLFDTLDTGRPHIAHDRLIDAPLHRPVLWMADITDSLAVLRATFGVLHVVTPIVSLALSWWVVRRVAPTLIVWPIVGIGLATLPGQINFISEGIKAHQLIWPVLLAVLVGLPPRTIPMVAMVTLVILYLHPAAAPILCVVAAAAALTAWRQPDARDRLVPLTGCLLISALLRFGMVADRYQTGEMNRQTFERQWSNSATGLPGVALALTFVLALLLVASVWVETQPRWLEAGALVLTGLAGVVLTMWATEPSRWWDALEFRGPTNVTSLTAAVVAGIDAIFVTRVHLAQSPQISRVRRWTGPAVAVTFAVVLSIQSVNYGRAIDDMNDSLAASPERCLDLSDLAGMPESPLNLWSTASLSLLYQGWKPTKIVLPDGGCELARKNGTLGVVAAGNEYRSDRIDLVPLQWQLGGHGACWWDERSGWHVVERTEIGRRRWSPGTGELRIFVGESSSVAVLGTVTTLQVPNSIAVIVNGERQQTIDFASAHEVAANGLVLHLNAGENLVQFDSANEAAHTKGDHRKLAFSLLNVQLIATGPSGVEEGCIFRP